MKARIPFYFGGLAGKILLALLVSSSAIFAQVNYSLSGTLSLASGEDPFELNGNTFTITAGLNQNAPPEASTCTSATCNYVYANVPATMYVENLGTVPFTSTVTLAGAVGGPYTFSLEGEYEGLAQITSTASIPSGYMISVVPSAFNSTQITAGSFSINIGGVVSGYDVLNSTLQATGTPPPAITPNPAAWTPRRMWVLRLLLRR